MEQSVWIMLNRCKDKNRYATKQQAKRAARDIERYKGTKTAPYRCPACHQWHLSTKRFKEEG